MRETRMRERTQDRGDAQRQQGRWVRVGTHRLFTRSWPGPPSTGTASTPPIVLIPGLGVGSRYMVPTAARLSAYRPVYVPDLPGFGASSTPPHALSIAELAAVLRHWMDVVGLERVVLLGNSLGCQILAHVAVENAERVSHAILDGPTLDPHIGPLMQVVRLLVDATREPPREVGIVIEDFLRARPLRILATYRAALRDHTAHIYPYMTMPTLIIRGARDPIVRQPWVDELTARLPRASHATIPGRGHASNYDAPETLVALVSAFLGMGHITSERERVAR